MLQTYMGKGVLKDARTTRAKDSYEITFFFFLNKMYQQEKCSVVHPNTYLMKCKSISHRCILTVSPRPNDKLLISTTY